MTLVETTTHQPSITVAYATHFSWVSIFNTACVIQLICHVYIFLYSLRGINNKL